MKFQSAFFGFTFGLLFIEIISGFPLSTDYEESGESYLEKGRNLRDVSKQASLQEEGISTGTIDNTERLSTNAKNNDKKSTEPNQATAEASSEEAASVKPTLDEEENSEIKDSAENTTKGPEEIINKKNSAATNQAKTENLKTGNRNVGKIKLSNADRRTNTGGRKDDSSVLSVASSTSKQSRPHYMSKESYPSSVRLTPMINMLSKIGTTSSASHQPNNLPFHPPNSRNDGQADKLQTAILRHLSDIKQILNQLMIRQANIEDSVYLITRHFPVEDY